MQMCVLHDSGYFGLVSMVIIHSLCLKHNLSWQVFCLVQFIDIFIFISMNLLVVGTVFEASSKKFLMEYNVYATVKA